jgi:dephospho-CoA kinase
MVGLTGGIGAGKSAVAHRLANHGAVVIDADRLARDAVAAGSDGLAEVVTAFGPGVLAQDGSLDRAAMSRLVFADPQARRRLEAIIHPRVRAETARLIDSAVTDAVIVNDVPLLVEAGLAGGYDLVIVVLADESIRVRRLAADRGMTADEAYARIRSQASDDQRRAVADVVIVNDGSLDDLFAQVDTVWIDRIAPMRAAADDRHRDDRHR